MTPTRIDLTAPDDWHLHLRDGEALASVIGHTAERFARAIVMPNLKPPVATVAQAEAYRQRILACLPSGARFQPLMTLYLTEQTSPAEIALAKASDSVLAVKYYPAGATTNSQSGVRDLARVHAVLEAMERHELPLLLHGEVTDPDIDIFDRERVFIERHLLPLQARFPALRMVLEHITTADAVTFITGAPAHVAATITAHHLLLNRNALFEGGIRPHHYCAPILKRQTHRAALLQAATSGDSHFSSAPTAPRMRGKPRRPRAAAPASIPPTPPSNCTPRPSSRSAGWIGWKPSPASTARTSTACPATRSASPWNARRGWSRPAIGWPPRPAYRCVQANRSPGRWSGTAPEAAAAHRALLAKLAAPRQATMVCGRKQDPADGIVPAPPDPGHRQWHGDLSSDHRAEPANGKFTVEQASAGVITTQRNPPSVKALFLGLLGQFGQPRLAVGELGTLVGHQVAEVHAPMRAHLVVGQFATFQQPDHVRARHIEEVGGLLGRQFGMDGHQADCVAGGHIVQNVDQHPQRLDRHLDFTVAVDHTQSRGLAAANARSKQPAAFARKLRFFGSGWGRDEWFVRQGRHGGFILTKSFLG